MKTDTLDELKSLMSSVHIGDETITQAVNDLALQAYNLGMAAAHAAALAESEMLVDAAEAVHARQLAFSSDMMALLIMGTMSRGLRGADPSPIEIQADRLEEFTAMYELVKTIKGDAVRYELKVREQH